MSGQMVSGLPGFENVANIRDAKVEVAAQRPEPIGDPVAPQPIGPVDSAGDTFDPTLHAVGRDGAPSITAAGRFRRRRGSGRSTSHSGDAAWREPAPGLRLPGVTDVRDLTPHHAAQLATGMWCNVGTMIFGSDWMPDSPAERGAVQGAFEDYFEATGITDLPPGWALAVTLGGYAATRFVRPTPSQRIASMIGWVRGRYAGWRMGRGTRANFGANGQRQNDTGATAHQRGGWLRRFRSGT